MSRDRARYPFECRFADQNGDAVSPWRCATRFLSPIKKPRRHLAEVGGGATRDEGTRWRGAIHDQDLFGMPASLLFRISDGRGAGDSPERAFRSEAEENEHRPVAREMSVIGVDVSQEYPDIGRLPCGTSMRLSNDRKGHDKLAAPACEKKVLVGFEATGGCEWRAWKRLVDEGVRVRQHPPKQIKYYGLACGKDAKADKDDAKVIASLMRFRPGVGREPPIGALRGIRANVAFRAQFVEIRKRTRSRPE